MASLEDLKTELEGLWLGRRNLRFEDIAGLARKFGRREVAGGKHTAFRREGWPPLVVPRHGGKTLKIKTAISCLKTLEEDLERLEMEKGNDNGD